MKKSVAVDLDGVLAEYTEWKGIGHFGDPIPGAVEFIDALREHFDIIIHTVRCSSEINGPESANLLVKRVRNWLDKHGFHYDHIWSEPGKPLAVAYIDDRAIRCEPQVAQGDKEKAAYYELIVRQVMKQLTAA